MGIVEPIREAGKIRAIKDMLRGGKYPRDYLLFVLGINVALRISDLLDLKVGDVRDGDGDIVESLYITESKTKKPRKIRLNRAAKEALEYYFGKVGARDGKRFLFESLRSELKLDRIRANDLIHKWCEAVGLKGKFGTHSLRKTWGYRARKAGVEISLIQEKLGHSNPAVTRRYIGITQEEVNDVEDRVCL